MAEFETARLDHEGAALEGQLLVPEGGGGRRPAVLVSASAMGLGQQVRNAARQLAEEGYVALATDMYGGGVHFTDPEAVGPTAATILDKSPLVRSRILAWYEWLKARPEVDPARIAAIGYCFGGQCALELARSGADIRAAISYHGTLRTTLPAERGAVKGLVSVFTGALDPFAPQQDVDALVAELRAAEARWHLTVFGDCAHSFASREDSTLTVPGMAYDPLADALSWGATLTTLRSVF